MSVVYVLNGKRVTPDGQPVTEELTAAEVALAVKSGELDKDTALEAEKKRAKPRKTVTDALE